MQLEAARMRLSKNHVELQGQLALQLIQSAVSSPNTVDGTTATRPGVGTLLNIVA